MHDQTLWPRGGSTVHLTAVRLFSLFLFARGNAQESKLENEFLFTPRINRNRRKTDRSSTVKPRSFKFPTYPAKLVAPHFLANFRRNVSVSHDTFSRYITYIKVPYVKNFVVIKSRLSRFSLSLSLKSVIRAERRISRTMDTQEDFWEVSDFYARMRQRFYILAIEQTFLLRFANCRFVKKFLKKKKKK